MSCISTIQTPFLYSEDYKTDHFKCKMLKNTNAPSWNNELHFFAKRLVILIIIVHSLAFLHYYDPKYVCIKIPLNIQ